MNKRTLVTGAGGFIGGRIVEILKITNKRDVIAGVRRWSSAARLGRFPIEFAKFDITKYDQVINAVNGVDEIIHCAYGPNSVTEEGTLNIVKAAKESGNKRVIHLSTISVYGDVAGIVDEDKAYSYTGHEYNSSKIKAEKICQDYIDKGLPVVILRPSIVYGPFSRNWTVNIGKMLIDGKMGTFSKHGEGYCNLVYVDDLVSAVIKALECDSCIGHTFNINGSDVLSWNDYFNKYNERLGLAPLETIGHHRAAIKSAIMAPVRNLGSYVKNNYLDEIKKLSERFGFIKKILQRTEISVKATPDPSDLKMYSHKVTYSIEKANRMMGYEPKTNADKGIEISAKWLKHHGFL